MDFGLFSNGERTNQIAADTYDEDLYEVTLADKLGFKEAWISEHLGSAKAGVTNILSMADMFIVKAAGTHQADEIRTRCAADRDVSPGAGGNRDSSAMADRWPLYVRLRLRRPGNRWHAPAWAWVQ